MRIKKPWSEWDEAADAKTLPGAMGVYELADEDQQTLYIGKASGRSPFGLRGELLHTQRRQQRRQPLLDPLARVSPQQPGSTCSSIAV